MKTWRLYANIISKSITKRLFIEKCLPPNNTHYYLIILSGKVFFNIKNIHCISVLKNWNFHCILIYNFQMWCYYYAMWKNQPNRKCSWYPAKGTGPKSKPEVKTATSLVTTSELNENQPHWPHDKRISFIITMNILQILAYKILRFSTTTISVVYCM